MDVTPELLYRFRSHDTEDLALEFVEEELGRFDWRANWATAKARGNLRERISQWLDAQGVEHDPDAIIACLEALVSGRPGRWR